MDINLEDFQIQEQNGLRLILPQRTAAVSNAAWNKNNLWLRSRIETKDGDTVSQGFGKSFNLDAGPDELRVTVESIANMLRAGAPIMATLKYDGSCLLRSVYNGKVMFRTRGSFSYGFHDACEAEMIEFKERYPRLGDPEWAENCTLLFEWVTPAFQIVVKYDQPDLILIGGVHHGHRHYTHLRYMTIAELKQIAQFAHLKLVEHFPINSVKDWYNFYHGVLNDKKIEGYVLRLGDNEQTLVKVKSESYLAKHGIKSNLSLKSMLEFWLQHGKGAGNTILGQVQKLYDEEIALWSLPFVLVLEEAIDKWHATLEQIKKEVGDRAHLARKDFAIEMQTRYARDKVLFSLAMELWQGREPQDNLIRSYMQRFIKEEPRGTTD